MRVNPWDQQFKRPAPIRKRVTLPEATLPDGTVLPEWELILRAPEPGEKDLIRDKQLEYIGRYVSGTANEDGKPLKLTTPEMPARLIVTSAALFNYVAVFETLAVPDEGDEAPTLLEIIGWRDNMEPHWVQLKAEADKLWSGRTETADPNPAGATATWTPSASP